jgi:hypothetical protein
LTDLSQDLEVAMSETGTTLAQSRTLLCNVFLQSRLSLSGCSIVGWISLFEEFIADLTVVDVGEKVVVVVKEV